MTVIFKVASQEEWSAADDGLYRGSAHDRRDGFIHFSTAEQLAGTLAKHYAGQNGLLLIAIDPAALGVALKWEEARNGDLFPHLYASLPVTAALWTRLLPLGEDGIHIIPAEAKA